MATLEVAMPDEIQRTALEVAHRQHISIDELLVRALMEKLSAVVPDQDLEDRAQKGNRDDFERFLGQVPNVPAEPQDRL